MAHNMRIQHLFFGEGHLLTIRYAIKDGGRFFYTAIIDYNNSDRELKEDVKKDKCQAVNYIHPKYNVYLEVLMEFTEYREVVYEFPIIYQALRESYVFAFQFWNEYGNVYLPIPIANENADKRAKKNKRTEYKLISI